MYTDKLIIDLNFHNRIIEEDLEPPFDDKRMFDLLSETIIDKRTLQLIEIHELFKAINHTTTLVGSARLFHSLNTPIESLELIHAKQEALRELESNDELSSSLEEYLGLFASEEKSLFRILNANHQPIFPYRDLNKAIHTIETMEKAVDNIPKVESIYLDSLIKLIQNFCKSSTYEVAMGPSFRTLGGIKAKSEKSFFTPSMRFRRGRLSGGTIGPAIPAIVFAIAWLTEAINPVVAKSMVLLTGGGIMLGFLYGALLKPMFDNETAILPLRKRLLDSNRFTSAVEAVASIDELLSFMRFRKSIPDTTVIPEVTDCERHFFKAEALKNPVSAIQLEDFVPNDVFLDQVGVTFITGPNSGGKTTYCKTIAQSQLLAQIGAPIVAKSAKINLADHISYQAPSFDSLNDLEGRFGTELSTTKKIFFEATPKSLVILDEIAEGTTSHERMELSEVILNGFLAKYNNTILVTHSYELAQTYRNLGKGQYRKVEFENNRPTHRFIEGISTESHAMRVARKIGFSPEDIKKHLEENGYI